MNSNGLEFDISSMDDSEFKMLKLASLTSEEFSEVPIEDQRVFTSININSDTGVVIDAVMPCDWVESDEDYKDRLKTDLKHFIIEELVKLVESSSETLGELIHNMGINSLMKYVTEDDINWLYEKLEADGSPDDIKTEIIRELSIYIKASEILLNHTNDEEDQLYGIHNNFYKEFIDTAPMNHGYIGLVSSYNGNMGEPILKEVCVISLSVDGIIDYDGPYTEEQYRADLVDLYSRYIKALED